MHLNVQMLLCLSTWSPTALEASGEAEDRRDLFLDNKIVKYT